jgi:3-oxoacyl-[acyl-carrier protein] reductase
LVTNAGKMFVGSIEDISEDEWDAAFTVNLKSVFLCCKAAIPYMKKHKFGRIITMSSAGGKNPKTITGTNYGVTKAGIIYLTKRVANDYGKYGITVNCISPGPVDTDMSKTFSKEVLDRFTSQIPLGRIGIPKDVAKVAVFLGSEDADYITGEVIDVNGGSYID